LPDFSWQKIPKQGKMCKIATKLPNYYKIYQNIPNGHICFYSKALQNLTPIRIFGFKIYHLATLVRNFFISPLRQLNIFFFIYIHAYLIKINIFGPK
jgi:hypothetical protein